MPTANRIFRRFQACSRALGVLGGGVARAMMVLGIAWFALMPVAQAMQLQAAAGLHEREAASAELAAAHKEVLAAQAETKRTRLALHDFLASHLDAQREAATESAPSLRTPAVTNSAERTKLSGELRELEAKRVVLLETLTEEHPEVIEVSARIEMLEARLNTSGMNELPAADNHAAEDAAGKVTGPALDAAEYQRLLRDWRTAERRLESARLAETAAADRLTAVTDLLLHSPASQSDAARETSAPPRSFTPPAELESQGAGEASSAAALAVSAEELHHEKASRTQTLALAALALAVMLAALAAVRLARATADPLFASADEVSAALAVPVMGIVPFGAKAVTAIGTSRHRGLVMLGQIALALALFSAVAYAIVHFDVVVQFLRNPVESLRSWFSL